ncbi:gamma-glutamylcyclotransferase family protein [Christiangramia crocea]|uniref:Putative gamma-glutamylcyclotransferase n=1 Tax=Christiangramia crocea TaxID=2904124 RepID=A0A9X2A597_9FLAO|nr:gamma-glutamylcyclotransferase family protein [Gramella crocea]MCG9971249.1 gamma-glutamylcyclotransferase [Gramella crocea]
MENLFVYGTLRDEKIRQNIFGRRIKGREDLLAGYEKYSIRIPDNSSGNFYPAIRPSKKEKSTVKGMVLRLKEEELSMADSYEGNSYFREKLKLQSGIIAWAYIGKK